jgi:hypothetical protein
MSLIRIRRRRKKEWIDVKRGKPPGKLILLLVFVALLFWFLGRF